MVRVYYDEDVDMEVLRDKTFAVIGYGNQGRAQALNLRDSGLQVVLGLRPEGASWEKAEEEGFEPKEVSTAAREGDVILLLVPDPAQPSVYKSSISSELESGKALYFSHGFNIHFKQIIPPKDVDVLMVAPKGPGKRLRETYQSGFGIPALIAVYQDASGSAKKLALGMSKALGCTRAGVLETTFEDETESDLIGEQTVLVGGLMELIKCGFETLVEAGYEPELAYFEACNEAKLIMDLIYERGITGMLRGVSDTAKYGGMTVGPKIIDAHVKQNMRKTVKYVQSGAFAREWTNKFQGSGNIIDSMMKKIESHPIERVGKKIRKMAGLEK